MDDLNTETPIQQIRFSGIEKTGIELFMKRDDLIHPFISGNKWRKLKYVLQDAKARNKNHLVSFGGAYSNHLVALACAGAIHGLHTTGFVRGEEVSNPMLSLCKLWGMQLVFTQREQYKNKNALFTEFFNSDAQAYFIDEGGKGGLAAQGCEEILDGVYGFTHVMCSVGTGTTIAGIARQAIKKGMIAEGICMLKGAEAIDAEIAELAGLPVKIHHGMSRGGYGKSDPELMAFIGTFASETGILLDQVYTGKMMTAIVQLIKEGYYKRGDKLLTIHTGGLLGLMGVLE